MATHVYDRPTFSRIVSKGRPTSWALGIPITILAIALLALAAFFAAKASDYQTQLGSLRLQADEAQKSADAAQKRMVQMEFDLAIATSPGTSTATLAPTMDSQGAWGSAIWGDVANKGFVTLRAYGLREAGQGQAYTAWFEGADGKPQLLGTLDPSPDGAAMVQGQDFADIGKGGRVFVNLADEAAKAVSGTTVLEAKLQPPAAKAQVAEE